MTDPRRLLHRLYVPYTHRNAQTQTQTLSLSLAVSLSLSRCLSLSLALSLSLSLSLCLSRSLSLSLSLLSRTLSLLLLVCIIKVVKLRDLCPEIDSGLWNLHVPPLWRNPSAAQVGNLGIASAAQGDLQTSRICLQRPRARRISPTFHGVHEFHGTIGQPWYLLVLHVFQQRGPTGSFCGSRA